MQLGTGQNGARSKYYKVFDNKFALEVDENTVGAVKRTNKEGRVVYETFCDWIAGHLIDIERREHPKFGDSYNFTFSTDEDNIVLQAGIKSTVGATLVKVLPNVDFSKPMKLVLSTSKRDDGSDSLSLFVNQENAEGKEEIVKWFYTNSDPKGMPPIGEAIVDGKPIPDHFARNTFLWEMIQRDIIPKLQGKSRNTTSSRDESGIEQESTMEETHGDLIAGDNGLPKDVPF